MRYTAPGHGAHSSRSREGEEGGKEDNVSDPGPNKRCCSVLISILIGCTLAYITSNRYRYRDTDTEPKDTQLQKEILCLVSGEVYVVACSLCLIIGFRLIASVLESKTAHEKLHQKGKNKE